MYIYELHFQSYIILRLILIWLPCRTLNFLHLTFRIVASRGGPSTTKFIPTHPHGDDPWCTMLMNEGKRGREGRKVSLLSLSRPPDGAGSHFAFPLLRSE